MANPSHLSATLAGRCANGYERDQGRRVHAVPYSDTLARNGYAIHAAACGAKPGARSAGWSLRTDLPVNCPRCLKRTAGVATPHPTKDKPTDGERDLAALCVRLVRRLQQVAPGDKLAATATEYLNQRRYLNPLRIKALEMHAAGVKGEGDG